MKNVKQRVGTAVAYVRRVGNTEERHYYADAESARAAMAVDAAACEKQPGRRIVPLRLETESGAPLAADGAAPKPQ